MEKVLIALMEVLKGYLIIWEKQTKKTRFFSLEDSSWLEDATTHIDHLVGLGKDVYFGLGSRRENLGESKRGSEEDILSLPGIGVDVDINDSGHASANYPETIERALELIKLSGFPTPSITVFTGGGLHLHWLFDSPLLIDSPDSLTEAKQLFERVQKYLIRFFRSNNYKLDATFDLARVFRVPDTKNFKLANTPRDVTIMEEDSSWKRFSIEEIKNWIPQGLPYIEATTSINNQFSKLQGQAHIALENCAFLQHCGKQATTLGEPEWHAMVNNLALTKGGAELIHKLSSSYPNYTTEETNAKIEHAIEEQKPHTCEYIRETLNFPDCPPSGCPFKSPVGWANSNLGFALDYWQDFWENANSKLEDVYDPCLLQHLGLLKLQLPIRFEKFLILLERRFKKAGFSRRNLLKALEPTMSRLKKQQKQVAKHAEVVELEGFSSILGFVPKLPNEYSFHDGFIGKQIRESFISFGKRLVFVSAFFDGNTQLVELTYDYGNGEWRRCVASRNEISSLGEITRLSDRGLPFNATNAKYWIDFLHNFMDTNHDCIPVRKSSNHYGWQDDGRFLPGNSDYLMIPNGKKKAVDFSTWCKGSIDDWKEIIQPVLLESLARLLLVASFAAPLLTIIGIRTFIVHIYGPSQGGKTAALKAAASIWQNPDEMMFNFNATKVAIERKISKLKNLPVVIDERQAAGNNQAFLDGLVYSLGEGHGKERGNRENGLQDVGSWCTVVLTSGEDPLSGEQSRQGVKTRALEIYAEKVFSDVKVASTMYQLAQKAFGVAGSQYIQWVTDSPQRVIDIYQHFKGLLQQTAPKLSASDYDYLAVLITADQIMNETCFDVPFEEDLTKVILPSFIPLIIEQRESILSQNDFQRTLDFIKSEVQNTRGKYAAVTTTNGTRRLNYNTNNMTSTEDGWILDEKDLYINPNILRSIAIKGEFSLTRFKKDAARHGLLKTTTDRGSISYTITTTKESGGEIVRMYCFPDFFTIEDVHANSESSVLKFTDNELRYDNKEEYEQWQLDQLNDEEKALGVLVSAQALTITESE